MKTLRKGDRIGNWTVLTDLGMVDGKHLFSVQCDCGETSIRRGRRLQMRFLQNGYVSCKPCAAKRKAKRLAKQKTPSFYWEKLFRQKMKAAEYAGHDWRLSPSEFYNLATQNCYYCGIKPKNIFQTYLTHSSHKIIYQGIDRIDSDLDYTTENCVSCCKQCNKAKLNYTVEEFLDWAHRLVSYQKRDD